MIDTRLRGSSGKAVAEVTENGAVIVAQSTAYVLEDKVTNIPSGRRFRVGGDGVFNLNVNGSVIPVDAYIRSELNGDLFLTTMSVVIADSALGLNKFGNLAALTNGCQLFYENTRGRNYYPLEFKTAFDFIRLSTLIPGFGGKNDTFQVAGAIAGSGADAYFINIDLTKFGPTNFGVRLLDDSDDKFGIRINDDLTGLDDFDIVCSGYVQVK